MSVIFNALEKKTIIPEVREEKREEIRTKDLPITAPPQETLLSVKLSIGFALFLSFAAIVAAIYLSQSFNAEKKEREVFEAGYAQSQEKLQMLEYETRQYQSDLTKIKGEVTDLGKVSGEITKKVEELQSEMSSVHQELAGVANAVREIKGTLQDTAKTAALEVPSELAN